MPVLGMLMDPHWFFCVCTHPSNHYFVVQFECCQVSGEEKMVPCIAGELLEAAVVMMEECNILDLELHCLFSLIDLCRCTSQLEGDGKMQSR